RSGPRIGVIGWRRRGQVGSRASDAASRAPTEGGWIEHSHLGNPPFCGSGITSRLGSASPRVNADEGGKREHCGQGGAAGIVFLTRRARRKRSAPRRISRQKRPLVSFASFVLFV